MRVAVILLALSLTGCTPALRNGLAKAADVILGPRIATETLTKAERLAAKAEKLATEAGLLEERAEEAADAPFRKCKAKRIGAAGADLSALALTLIESECRLLHPSVAVAPVERPETFAQCMARLCPVDCEASESLWGLAHQACLGKPEG